MHRPVFCTICFCDGCRLKYVFLTFLRGIAAFFVFGAIVLRLFGGWWIALAIPCVVIAAAAFLESEDVSESDFCDPRF